MRNDLRAAFIERALLGHLALDQHYECPPPVRKPSTS
jgi:hypothetical protein